MISAYGGRFKDIAFTPNIDRLLDYLDESGLAKNTIVIYFSDMKKTYQELRAQYEVKSP